MKIIEPKVELWPQGDSMIAHVARCARVCYRKETGNDEALYKHLKDNRHLSVFRHFSIYVIGKLNDLIMQIINDYDNCPYIKYSIDYSENNIYISTNLNFVYDLKNSIVVHDILLYDYIIENIVEEDRFRNTEHGFNLMRYTFCVDTQISTSRELNRVSPNNIIEQSTRYVYEDGTICRPHWMFIEEANSFNNDNHAEMTTIGRNYVNSCEYSFGTYKDLIEINGMHRQDARGVLPIDTATRCIYTYFLDEWRAIIDLRYYGTTGKPHPNAKLIAGMIREELMSLGYNFR